MSRTQEIRSNINTLKNTHKMYTTTCYDKNRLRSISRNTRKEIKSLDSTYRTILEKMTTIQSEIVKRTTDNLKILRDDVYDEKRYIYDSNKSKINALKYELNKLNIERDAYADKPYVKILLKRDKDSLNKTFKNNNALHDNMGRRTRKKRGKRIKTIRRRKRIRRR